MSCLSERELSSYIDQKLSAPERGRIESHISGCKDCLDMLVVAYDAGRVKRKSPAPKKAGAAFKWFAGFIILFSASFIFRKFFLQFLIAAAVFGFRWAMEGEGVKKTIMIFKNLPANPHRSKEKRKNALQKRTFSRR